MGFSRPAIARLGRTAVLAASAVLAACSASTPDLAPVVRAIEPSRGYAGASTRVTIRGDGFYARAAQGGGAGDRTVDTRHRVWLDDAELTEVSWVDPHTLTAVIPPGLAAGAHAVAVENAYGRRAALAGAYQVSAVGSPPVLTATVAAGTATASRGQLVDLAIDVHNGGGSDALGVAPVISSAGTGQVTPVAPITPQDVPAGGVRSFTTTLRADAAGALTVLVGGSGRDAFTGLAADLAPAEASLRVMRPGALALVAALSAARVTVGGTVTLTVTATNSGEVAVKGVEPALPAVTGTGAVAVTAYPAPVDVPAGGSATLVYVFAAVAPGDVGLHVGAAGTDGLSGAATAADPVDGGPLTVEAPGALATTVAVSPPQVSVGQPATVTATVVNSGGATVRGVLPALTALPDGVQVLSAPAGAQDVAGGGTAVFTWVLGTTAVASAPVQVTAAGVDPDAGGGAVGAAPASAPLVVQSPAQLAVAVGTDRVQASVGQDVTVTATLRNVGGAVATGVAAAVSVPPGFAPTPIGAPAASALRLPPGAYATLAWTFRSVASGVGAFGLQVSGADGNSGASVAAAAATSPVATQRPAAVAIVAAPSRARVTAGQTVSFSATVTNTGEAALLAVQVAAVPSGGALLTPLSSPAPFDLAAGASATVSLAFASAGAGDVGVQVTASGADANSGRAATAAAAPFTVTVQAPASLTTALALSAARVSAGQPVTLTATVTNAGGATVTAATLALASVPAGVVARAAPAPQTVAGGASVVFRWTLDTTTAPVAGAILVDCAGADGNGGDPVTAPQAAAPIAVDTPASLAATASVDLAQVSVGQLVAVTVHVTNGGTAPAAAVAPAIVPPAGVAAAPVSAPPPQDIPGGAAIDFRWTFQTTAAATGGFFAASVAGRDGNSGAALSASAAAGPLTIQLPGALDVTPSLSQLSANVGQTVALRVVVHNGGQATVAGVAPVVTAAGTGTAFLLAAPQPVDVPGGATVPLDLVYSAAAAGSVTFTVVASGSDVNSGTAVAAAASSAGPVTVQTPPGLTAVLALAQQVVSVGQQVVLTADVTNGGSATALAATPSLASVPAGLTLRAAPTPRDVAGNATVRFQWTFDTGAPTSGAFQVDCSATDANTSATITAPRATSPALSVQAAAALGITTSTDRQRADVGQTVTLTVTVTNSGTVAAQQVETTAVGQGAAPAAALTLPNPAKVSIPGGSSRSYTYVFQLPGPAGPATFAVTAAGTDANSGAAVTASATAGPVAVQTPAALQVAVAAAPAQVSLGQPITVTMAVTNTGGADAVQVAPGAPLGQGSSSGASATLSAGPTPGGTVTIAGGATQTFTWTYLAQSAGLLAFSGSASGRDANTSAYLGSDVATSPTVTLQTGAALSTSFSSIPARVNRNQTFPVTIAVTDSGQAAASQVAPAITGSAGLTPGAAPAPAASLGGGATLTFSRTFTAGAVGSATVQADVAATDANSGAAVSAPRVSATVVVENPAALAAALSLPTSVGVNRQFTVTMTVTNSGDAVANLVAPTSLAISPASTALATLVAGPSPSTHSVPKGTPAVFTWTYLAGTTGSLQLSGSAQGYDGNDGSTVSSALATSAPVSVSEAVLLASDPFGDGTAYADLAGYRGMLWIGPRQDGAALASMALDGTGLQSSGLSLPKDTVSAGTKSTNGWSGAPPFPSLGAAGCAPGTAACGPDNENGRGLFASAIVGGEEWLVAVGGKPGATLNYAYLSSDPAGSVFTYADLSQQLSGEARAVSALAVASGRVFLGISGKGGSSPGLVSIDRLPSGGGLDPGGTAYATDLAASKMPGIGASGNPKNSATNVLIDSMAVFQGRLYLANNGGFVRATVASPRPYTIAASDWAACTPAAATGKTALTSASLTDLEPADRAVPQLASFGGRLFAIRNVYLSGSSGAAGGQLWMCTPSTVDAGGSTQCGASDWTLVVPESSADGLEQATLLVATSRYLYVGFDDATGVRLFRTAQPAPASLGDFAGTAGCVAGTAGCQGLGGNGFGDPTNRRLFGSTALADAQGNVRLYLATGDTTATPAVPVRVYRIEE